MATVRKFVARRFPGLKDAPLNVYSLVGMVFVMSLVATLGNPVEGCNYLLALDKPPGVVVHPEFRGNPMLAILAELHKRIISQEKAISALARAIRRSRAGLKASNRPAGSFLFHKTHAHYHFQDILDYSIYRVAGPGKLIPAGHGTKAGFSPASPSSVVRGRGYSSRSSARLPSSR